MQVLTNMYLYNNVEHLTDIKFSDLGANTSWLTLSLANQLSS